MSKLARRDFFRIATAGAAAAGVGGLILREHVCATEPSGGLGDYAKQVAPPAEQSGLGNVKQPAQWNATEDNIWGPYFRKSAPFRAKITPPLEPGMPLLISGRVWGLDSRKPLANAMIDVWQANAQGRYDNDDPKKPPAADVFANRARVLTDENGYYEYETVHPGRYSIGDNLWRPSHIHYYIQATGYKPLVTQLYFKGDPMNAKDEFIRQSLIIELETVPAAGGKLERGVFDIVLAKA